MPSLRAGRVRKGKRKPVSPAHADLTLARVSKILEGIGIRRVTELNVDVVNSLLDRLQAEGELQTNQTRKHYERTIKSFSSWLVGSGELDLNPFRKLDVTYVDSGDVVHDRGAFRPEEIEAIAAATRGTTPLRGLSSDRRTLLYLFAASTGLRARNAPRFARRILHPT